MYSEKVMDHFNHPRNVGEIENASGVGTVSCVFIWTLTMTESSAM